MSRFKSEESRLAYFVKKYGEEEGQRRYDEAGPITPTDPPMDDLQGSGSALAEKAPRRRAKKPSKDEVYKATGTGIYLADQGLCWLWPPWSEERLTQEEVGALAIALGDEILSSERLVQMLVNAQKQSVHAKLAYVLATIAIPRMLRRGVLPTGQPDQSVEETAADEPGTVVHTDAGWPVSMGAGRAHGDHRDDGLGEVDAGLAAAAAAPLRAGAAQQGGQDPLPGSDQDDGGQPYGRPPSFAFGARAPL